MSTELALFEGQLKPLEEKFAQVLPAAIPSARLMRTIMISVERNPKLLAPNLRASLLRAAMTASVLGLEVDGVTGQGFLLPFGGKHPCVQFIPGYKGYNTIAGRAGYTINGAVVREGDTFDYMEGSAGYVDHKRQLGDEAKRKIIAAWATATKPNSTPIISILSIDELMAIKGESMGAKKNSSPWNDPTIGFPAMCEKSAKRRLARSMPLNTYQLGAAMESQQDIGNPCHVNAEAELVIDGEVERVDEQPSEPKDLLKPDMLAVTWIDGEWREVTSIAQWREKMKTGIDKLQNRKEDLKRFREANQDTIMKIAKADPEAMLYIDDLFRTHLGK